MKPKKIDIDPVQYASQGNGILGIRDSGKSYTATAIAEQLMDAGIPFITFDAIGIWKHLRIMKDGKPGYPVVIVGGRNGDLPLTTANAANIVRAAMKNNISLVIDLFSMELSKADWKRIVESCIRLLLYENENYGQRHVFIEEAAEFAPQKLGPDTGKVYAEIEKLARMGGNVSLGYTLINQRAEEVNKAVLELCDCLFLHRQKGRNSLTALGKWLSIADTDNSSEIIKSLPSLEQGECWVWLPGSHSPVRTKIPTKKTIHPDRQKRVAFADLGKAADVSKQLVILKLALEPEKGKAKEAFVPKPISTTETDKLKSDLNIYKERDQVQTSIISAQKTKIDKMSRVLKKVLEIAPLVEEALKENTDIKISVAPIVMKTPVNSTAINKKQNGVSHPSAHTMQLGQSIVGKCERAILSVLAQRENTTTTKNQLAILSQYSIKSSGFANGISKLRTGGLLSGTGDNLSITDEGRAVLGDYDPLPTGKQLHSYWIEKLGKCEGSILRELIEIHPSSLSKEGVAERTGYSTQSSGFANGLSKLRTLQLIEGKSELTASESLFQ